MVEADLIGDFGDVAEFVAHQLGGTFESDGANELAGRLVGKCFYFPVQLHPAHGHLVAEFRHIQVGILNVLFNQFNDAVQEAFVGRGDGNVFRSEVYFFSESLPQFPSLLDQLSIFD